MVQATIKLFATDFSPFSADNAELMVNLTLTSGTLALTKPTSYMEGRYRAEAATNYGNRAATEDDLKIAVLSTGGFR